ncbi:MAG: flavin reductase, partial [Clostridium perfringens]|nr:flavin reductase [Clostridium perfringens]
YIIDGTPYAVKVARTVWSGGKIEDNIKDLPIAIKCFYESNNKIPLIEECPINMECKVTKIIEIYDMEVFIGEIIETYVNEDLLTNGFPDTKKINPLIYSMDNNYWEIGNFIGNAFNIGKNIK